MYGPMTLERAAQEISDGQIATDGVDSWEFAQLRESYQKWLGDKFTGTDFESNGWHLMNAQEFAEQDDQDEDTDV